MYKTHALTQSLQMSLLLRLCGEATGLHGRANPHSMCRSSHAILRVCATPHSTTACMQGLRRATDATTNMLMFKQCANQDTEHRTDGSHCARTKPAPACLSNCMEQLPHGAVAQPVTLCPPALVHGGCTCIPVLRPAVVNAIHQWWSCCCFVCLPCCCLTADMVLLAVNKPHT